MIPNCSGLADFVDQLLFSNARALTEKKKVFPFCRSVMI